MTTHEALALDPDVLARRCVGEWHVRSATTYERPFLDVTVDARFTSPTGRTLTVPAFYDGEGTWKVRFNPDEAGDWTMETLTRPHDPDLTQSRHFVVTERDVRGFLRSTPDRPWGYTFANGEPFFPFGDTAYNLFGMAHCGYDVEEFIQRRSRQGFNLLRVRLPVSPFHPPEGFSEWQTRSTWPWGGSEQVPLFDRFNLEYFRTVDDVMLIAERYGMGIEMIMEAWGFEFPFNSRLIFTAEWELLWMRYLIARYDAFTSTFFWTPQNEYEFYPNGDWNYKEVADLWLLRIARWIKETAPHGHCIAAHNGPRMPPFAARFARDPEVIDTIMYQNWGSMGDDDAWLADGIDDGIQASLAGWNGSAIMAEWGYERNPALDLKLPGHQNCDVAHTRRGAWRSVFSGLGIIHGFENTWGPWCVLDEDQAGVQDLLHVLWFVKHVVRDAHLVPQRDLAQADRYDAGRSPLVMATRAEDLTLVYFPAGGSAELPLPTAAGTTQWFDPRSGEITPADVILHDGITTIEAPQPSDPERPDDWVLICDARGPDHAPGFE